MLRDQKEQTENVRTDTHAVIEEPRGLCLWSSGRKSKSLSAWAETSSGPLPSKTPALSFSSPHSLHHSTPPPPTKTTTTFVARVLKPSSCTSKLYISSALGRRLTVLCKCSWQQNRREYGGEGRKRWDVPSSHPNATDV